MCFLNGDCRQKLSK
ncbi:MULTISPECIES: hypothetical protein [Clostridia]